MTDQTLNIYQRINAVMKDVAYLKKDGVITVPGGSYTAITHDAVTAALRSSMVEHGIVMDASVIKHKVHRWEPLKEGRMAQRTTIAHVQCALVNIDRPDERVEGVMVGYGQDSGDKGIGKAISYAVKYFLLKQFSLETGENEESREEMALGRPISDTEAELMMKYIEETGTDEAEFVEFLNKQKGLNLGKLGDITTKDLPYAMAALKHKKKNMEKGKAPPKKKAAPKKQKVTENADASGPED